MTYSKKPYETPIINIPYGHPHAEGLVAHYLFNGSALSVFDWTQNQNDLNINNDNSGLNWDSQDSAADNFWYDVCYGNGLFVAVAGTGTGNRVMSSPDGENWTIQTSAADNNWRGVCYGNGLFVAVSDNGTGNRVMTSPDGENWTVRTSAADNMWLDVCYGNGLFVAVAGTGTGNRVMTSPDGENWTLRTSAADNDWYGVCYGNGLFVAVSSNGTGNRVMTSPDGITWTSRTSAADNNWQGVCYGKGLFVAVSITGSGNRVMTSPDGITWTSRTTLVDNLWYDVCYGDGLFVAVTYTGTGNRVMTSSNAITWNIGVSAADNGWLSVCHGDGLFVAVANSGTGDRVMTASSQNISTPIYVPEGLLFDTAGEYALFDNTKQRVNSEAGTIIIKFRSLASFNNGETNVLFGCYFGGPSNGDFVLGNFGDAYLYFIIADSVGGHWVRITEPDGWETGVQISIMWNRSKAIWNNDNMVINVNGVNITPDNQDSETSWNSFTVNSLLYVGNDAANAYNHCNGIIEYLSIHDQVIVEEQLESVYNNPHDIFNYINY